jgi:hypothetical protein|tara:strand:+ start:728 stop:1213 length:486 start_codon:yes stop_codon:yes gene_type:complete
MPEMKLIMENWNVFLEQEVDKAIPSGITTVGELRLAIKLMRAKQAGGAAGKKAASMLISMIPGGGAAVEIISGAKDAADMIKRLYGADDSFKTGTGLDKLNVDDDIAKIVDDPIEVAYLNYLLKDKFQKAPDEQPLDDFDATIGLQDYIASKFNKKTVKAV